MKKLANYTKWMLTISGVLMILVGLLLIMNPFGTGWSMANVVGWIMLAAAIIDVVAFIANFNKFYAGWILVRGIVTGIIGAMLAFHPETSIDIIMMIFGIWIIITGGVQFANSFIAKALHQKEWYWPMLGGLIEIIAGGIILVHPGFTYVIAAYVIAVGLIVDGIVNFIDAFKIQKGLNEMKRWEKAIKKLFAAD